MAYNSLALNTLSPLQWTSTVWPALIWQMLPWKRVKPFFQVEITISAISVTKMVKHTQRLTNWKSKFSTSKSWITYMLCQIWFSYLKQRETHQSNLVFVNRQHWTLVSNAQRHLNPNNCCCFFSRILENPFLNSLISHPQSFVMCRLSNLQPINFSSWSVHAYS